MISRLFLLLMCAGVLLPEVYGQRSLEQQQQLFERALHRGDLTTSRLTSAHAIYRQTLKFYPEEEQILDQMRTRLSIELREAADSIISLYDRGSYIQAGTEPFSEGVSKLKLALSLNPPFATPQDSLKLAFLEAYAIYQSDERRNKGIALKKFDDLASEYPGQARFWHARGQMAQEEELPDLAKSYFWEAVRRNSRWAYPFCSLGAIYLDEGKMDSAALFLRRSLQLQPVLPMAAAYLGRLYLENEQYEQAHQYLDQAVKNDSVFYLPHYYQALLLNKEGHPLDALQAVGAALDRKSDFEPARQFLKDQVVQMVDRLANEKAYEKAATVYEQWAFRNQDDPEIVRKLAGLYLDARTYERANEVVELAMQLEPEDATNYYLKARLLAGKGEYAQAYSALQQALRFGWEDHGLAEPEFNGFRDDPRVLNLLDLYQKP